VAYNRFRGHGKEVASICPFLPPLISPRPITRKSAGPDGPYFLPAWRIRRAPATWPARRGVDVRLRSVAAVLPSPKVTFMQAALLYSRLLKAGVRIYEYQPLFCT